MADAARGSRGERALAGHPPRPLQPEAVREVAAQAWTGLGDHRPRDLGLPGVARRAGSEGYASTPAQAPLASSPTTRHTAGAATNTDQMIRRRAPVCSFSRP